MVWWIVFMVVGAALGWYDGKRRLLRENREKWREMNLEYARQDRVAEWRQQAKNERAVVYGVWGGAGLWIAVCNRLDVPLTTSGEVYFLLTVLLGIASAVVAAQHVSHPGKWNDGRLEGVVPDYLVLEERNLAAEASRLHNLGETQLLEKVQAAQGEVMGRVRAFRAQPVLSWFAQEQPKLMGQVELVADNPEGWPDLENKLSQWHVRLGTLGRCSLRTQATIDRAQHWVGHALVEVAEARKRGRAQRIERLLECITATQAAEDEILHVVVLEV